MNKFDQIVSKVIPLPIRDVDTDMIIPAEFLKSISREGYGENVFKRLREQNKDFPFNLEKYADAEILLADDNFGCGSSREHAVWALYDWGIRVVISSSFADIFAGNAGKNGLVLVELDEPLVRELMAKAQKEELKLHINLENQTLSLPDGTEKFFDFDPFRKHCILSGLDDIDYINTYQEQIESFRSKQSKVTFFNTCKANF